MRKFTPITEMKAYTLFESGKLVYITPIDIVKHPNAYASGYLLDKKDVFSGFDNLVDRIIKQNGNKLYYYSYERV